MHIKLYHFSDCEAELVTSMIDGVVAAIAAGLVLYELTIGGKENERQSDIEEAQFILQYNQAFIQDENICKVERLLERSMLCEVDENFISDENRQEFINYLVYLEGLASLILNDVLKLEHVDDLFAFRYFVAMNNRTVQRDQLFQYPQYYRGCFMLYEKWSRYRKDHKLEILLNETSLEKWIKYEECICSPITVRMARASDDLCSIARLIYETDPYIYPAAFGSEQKAQRVIPKLVQINWSFFDLRNIIVAAENDRIVGLAIVLQSPISPIKTLSDALQKDLRLNKNFTNVFDDYFKNIGLYFYDCSVYIACISVSRDWRRKRIGDMLIKNIIHKLPNQNIKLHVLCENTNAIALYNKYGFESKKPLTKGYSISHPRPKCREMIYHP